MNITWYGHSCFKLQSKEVFLIMDPFNKEIGLKPPFDAADIVTISHEHSDHNNRDAIKGEPFVIDGPGEYEIKKVVIRGIESSHDKEESAAGVVNTIFTVLMDDIRFCHLGDLGQKSLEAEQLKAIGEVDVLFVPIGGVFTINAKEADAIISQIEPRIIIPMHYKVDGVKGELVKLDDIKAFSQNHSLGSVDTVSKISIKKKDLPEDEPQYIVMDLGK
ncbi:MAG: MBL fold metallo-hydrolase [Candidatus Paceibacterota bacterium]